MEAVVDPHQQAKAFTRNVVASITGGEVVPSEWKAVVPFAIGKALADLLQFGEELAKTIAATHRDSPHSERYLFVPGEQAVLFLDKQGHIVKLTDPLILACAPKTAERVPATRELMGFESGEFLTGPRRGTFIRVSDQVIPYEPEYRPGVVGVWCQQNILSGVAKGRANT